MSADSLLHPCPPNPPEPPFPEGRRVGLRPEPKEHGASRWQAGVWQVDPQHPATPLIRCAGELLSHGGVIIYPTETYYGLGGNPRLLAAIERIYGIKGREFSKPLPLIASNREAVYRVVADWPLVAERLAEAFWPGPLTLILRAASSVLPLLHAQTGKVAVRISSHPVAQALAAAIGGVLTATSANQSGQPAYRTPTEMPEELLAQVDGLVDAGLSGVGSTDLPSTIVDVSTATPRLVRPGCISWERLERVMNDE
jgi:L-threonylcarbamoyladenylate synthase